jgi:N-glycosylase/DNA lyase
MGFRAPYLKETAAKVVCGEFNPERLATLTLPDARAELLELPGVGRKIADCVLLFAYGFQEAFPVDVWIRKALREFYFPKKRPSQKRLQRFSETHFGRYAGYAQQYLFHYARTRQ